MYKFRQLDSKITYLKTIPDKDIFNKQLEGFEQFGEKKKNLVCRPQKKF